MLRDQLNHFSLCHVQENKTGWHDCRISSIRKLNKSQRILVSLAEPTGFTEDRGSM
jgi:hypothetical protein